MRPLETHTGDHANPAEIKAVHHIPRSYALDQVKVVRIAALGCGLVGAGTGDSVEQAAKYALTFSQLAAKDILVVER